MGLLIFCLFWGVDASDIAQLGVWWLLVTLNEKSVVE